MFGATRVQAHHTKTIWQTEVGIGVNTAPKKGFLPEGCRSAALGGPKDLEDIVPQV